MTMMIDRLETVIFQFTKPLNNQRVPWKATELSN